MVDILAGRDDGRGVLGGENAAVAEGGDTRLEVAAGSLPTDTALTVAETPFSSFSTQVPTALEPLSELRVDLSGQVLGQAALASVSLERVCANAASIGDPCPETGFDPGLGVVVARVERIAGVPRLAVVAQAEVVEGRLVTRPTPGLPGVVEGGRYVFYRLTEPIGFVSGQTLAAGVPVSAAVALCRTSCSRGRRFPARGHRLALRRRPLGQRPVRDRDTRPPSASVSLVAFIEGTNNSGTATAAVQAESGHAGRRRSDSRGSSPPPRSSPRTARSRWRSPARWRSRPRRPSIPRRSAPPRCGSSGWGREGERHATPLRALGERPAACR